MIDSFSGKYSFLSNFYYAAVTYDGKMFPTLEHAFVVAKVRFWSEFVRQTGLSYGEYIENTPGQAKRIGRKVELRNEWDTVKFGVMYNLLVDKFNGIGMRKKLLATGNDLLIEGNRWHDNTWGVCTCAKCRKTARGRNALGLLLMKVRAELRDR